LFKYDPDAEATRFMKFLEEVFSGDPDKDDKIKRLLEVMGYTLLASTKYEKFVVLVGPGANGKSVLLRVLRYLVSPENIASVQPDQFDRQFQRANLMGKHANIITELSTGNKIPAGQLKAIVSGEPMTAEFKHKPAFEFIPFCTVWLATNHMVKFSTIDDALVRRIIVIPFNRVFTEEEQDRELPEKLRAELPGILNLALEGLDRLFRQGQFTKTDSGMQTIDEWRFKTEHVEKFVSHCCSLNPEATVRSADLYEAYEQWAEENSILHTLPKNPFIRQIKTWEDVDSHKGAKGVRELSGIELKNNQ